MQEKLEEQLRPLFALLEDIQGRLAKGGKVPNFGSLKDWALVSHISSSLPKLIYHPGRIPASLSIQLIVFLKSFSCMIFKEQVKRSGQICTAGHYAGKFQIVVSDVAAARHQEA